MPAGTDLFPYVKFLTASMLSMMAGAQAVHAYYKPDMTIPEIPPERGELGRSRDEARKAAENQIKTKEGS